MHACAPADMGTYQQQRRRRRRRHRVPVRGPELSNFSFARGCRGPQNTGVHSLHVLTKERIVTRKKSQNNEKPERRPFPVWSTGVVFFLSFSSFLFIILCSYFGPHVPNGGQIWTRIFNLCCRRRHGRDSTPPVAGGYVACRHGGRGVCSSRASAARPHPRRSLARCFFVFFLFFFFFFFISPQILFSQLQLFIFSSSSSSSS